MRIVGILVFIIGLILVVDQLYMFGIPIGPFLPDMSVWDITGSPVLHHWMVGVIMMYVGFVLYLRIERR